MLSPKPWNTILILRLLLGAFACLCLGSLIVNGVHFPGTGTKALLFFSISAVAVLLLILTLFLLSRPWDTDDLIGKLLLMLVCLTTGLSFAVWAQQIAGKPAEGTSGEQMAVTEAAVLVFFTVFMRAQRITWAEAFGIANGRRRAILSGLAVACIFLPVAEGLQLLSAEVMTRFRVEPQEQQAVHALRVSVGWSNRLVLAVLALVLAPVVEEMFFRGMLYPLIKQAGFPRLAFWGVSFVFACVHFNVATFVPLLVLAVILTALYERTDNLLAPISAHALFNSLNFAMLYLLDRQMGR
jgi:membrane protease YdiL (CAAX protease family)